MSELMYMPTDLLWSLSYQIVAAAVTPVSRERAALRRLLLRREAFPALTLWSSAGSVSLEGVCGLDRLLGVRPLRPSSSSCSEVCDCCCFIVLRMCEILDCVPPWVVGRVALVICVPCAAIGSLFYIVRR